MAVVAGRQHDTSTDGLDFSSLIHDAERAQQVNRSNAASSCQTRWERNTMMNSNLSNVIENIQDEGPARNTQSAVSESIRDDEASLSQAAVNRHDEFIREQMTSDNPEPDIAARIPRKNKNFYSKTVTAILCSNKYQLFPMLLILVVTTVMLAINLRTESRFDSLSSMVEARYIRDSDTALGTATLPSIQDVLPEIDTRLTAFEHNIHELRTEIDKQVSSLDSMKADVEQAVTRKLAQDSDIQFADTMLVQRKLVEIEKLLANMELPAVVTSTARASVVSDKAIPETTTTEMIPHVWAVNIATLSDNDRAITAMRRLQDAGYTSSIQELQRDDTTLYRLSVGGFQSIEQAEQFIEIAKTRFGFEGGWIQNG